MCKPFTLDSLEAGDQCTRIKLNKDRDKHNQLECRSNRKFNDDATFTVKDDFISNNYDVKRFHVRLE